MSAADDFIHHMRAQDPSELKRLREEAWAVTGPARRGYDPNCPLARPHGHHWNGLGPEHADCACGCDCPRCPECQQLPENCDCD